MICFHSKFSFQSVRTEKRPSKQSFDFLFVYFDFLTAQFSKGEKTLNTMRDIAKYTEEELKKTLDIRDYKEENIGHGIKRITYNVVDRAEGSLVGGVLGTFGGTIGVVATWACLAGAALATPVFVAVLVGVGVAAVVGGAVIGAAIGANDPREHYFDETSGQYLGSTKIAASKKANELGTALMKSKNFSEATDLFSKAHKLAEGNKDIQKEIKHNWDHAQAEKLNDEGEKLMNQGKFEQAEDKFKEAKKESPTSESESLRKINGNLIKVYNRRGASLWNEAWRDEEKGDSVVASRKFQAAQENFKKAGNSQMLTTVDLKIKGNELFNQALSVQKQAHQLQEQQKYEESVKLYRQSTAKFQQAFDSTGDTRFNDSKQIVEESIAKLNKLISLMESEKLNKIFSQINTSATKTEDVEKRTNTDTFEREFE